MWHEGEDFPADGRYTRWFCPVSKPLKFWSLLDYGEYAVETDDGGGDARDVETDQELSEEG